MFVWKVVLVWKYLLYGIEIYYIIRHILYEGSYVRKGYVYEWLGEMCILHKINLTIVLIDTSYNFSCKNNNCCPKLEPIL
jgi:hypothetical protein